MVMRCLLLMSIGLFSFISEADSPDWSNYAKLLGHYVVKKNVNNHQQHWVSYSKLRQGSLFYNVVRDIQYFPLHRLHTREEKLAFYINAYNILAMKMVIEHWPVDSIKDIGYFFSPVWEKPAGRLGRKIVSLDEVEHKILRPMKEPRIHFALVCASIGCPDLLQEPFTAEKLDQQLDHQVTHYLNSNKGLVIKSGYIRVSKIFHWFAKDFKAQGGVDKWIRRYRRDLPLNLPIKADLPYDWSLNGQ